MAAPTADEGYRSTFISVADDSRATTGEVPRPRPSGPTVASAQFTMLSGRPGHWTQADVLFASSPALRGRDDIPPEERARLRDEYFAEPRACLRASPLPKTHGWGVHFDAEGRITLHAVDSPEYERLRADPSLTQVKAMRSSRAKT